MDFNDSPEEAAYRAKARAWLAANAADFVSTRPGAPKENTPEFVECSRRWAALKADAGYSCIALDKAWGGGGGDYLQHAIFADEEAAADVRYNAVMLVAHYTALPTILAVGSEAQKEKFIRANVRGEYIWCQLFSEPSGGSDIAAARTRAVRDGDGWRISGQKIWTSYAQFCDYGLVLVRTNPDAPKHKGLTMFIMDMHAPGVEARPIRQMTDDYEFNEVFFDNVYLPDSARIGEVGKGWNTALVTMANERFAVGGANGPDYSAALRVARETRGLNGPLIQDKATRAKIADWYIAFEGIKRTRLRAMTALSRGLAPGPENSIGKLVIASQTQDLSNGAVELEDQFGVIDDPIRAHFTAGLQHHLLFSPCERIAGGTDEIQRNVIAERVLGLPGDIRVDKDVAFKDLPTGR
ncbi:MAG: acyl-CoA dehydrogenase family protein [Hyphomonadaceae bacterium]